LPVSYSTGRPPAFLTRGILSVLSLVILSACDSGPGTTSTETSPPRLSEFTFNPVEIGIDAANSGMITFPLTMRVAAAGEEIESVRYLVRSPDKNAAPISEGELARVDGNHYERTVDISIQQGKIGLYTVLVYGVGSEGVLGNSVRGNLRVIGTGEPPVIVDIIAPDTVRLPAAGQDPTRVPLVAQVEDPDGLSNINRVIFWNAALPNVTFEMFDDGEGGDDEAGDGFYTRVVEIASTNQPGTTTLVFQAIDRAGLESETRTHEIEVVE